MREILVFLLTKSKTGIIIFLSNYVNGGEFVMDQIMEIFSKIDIEKIIEVVKKVVAWVQESGIIEKVIDFVKDIVAKVA